MCVCVQIQTSMACAVHKQGYENNLSSISLQSVALLVNFAKCKHPAAEWHQHSCPEHAASYATNKQNYCYCVQPMMSVKWLSRRQGPGLRLLVVSCCLQSDLGEAAYQSVIQSGQGGNCMQSVCDSMEINSDKQIHRHLYTQKCTLTTYIKTPARNS